MLYEFPDGFLFPFYGTTFHAAMVNSDGNLTFRGDDVASDARDEQRFLSGLPRIAPLFTDLDPGERGTVRAEFNSGIMRFIWEDVPEFSPEEGKPGNTFSVALFPNGNVWFGYGAISLTTDIDGTQAVVGLSRGESGPSSTTDLSESPIISVGDESIHEAFLSNTFFDLSNQQLLFVVDEAPTGELTASPNPVSVCDGSALGRTTLSWNFPGVERTEIRLGSPVGALLSVAGSSGSVETGSWVRDGTVFYLVDGADGSVLASEVVRLDMLGCGIRLTADPNPVQTCAEISSVTLTWEAPGTNTVEIRLGSPDGVLFLQGPGTGSQQTGNWVENGTIFYMLNADNGGVLATETVSFDRIGCPAILSADPNPIQVCDGSGVGETTLEWESDGSSVTEIRIGSPGGQLFVQSNINGSVRTGKWVTNGMEFYLVNGTSQAVLASETVFHSQQGCPANIQVTFSPNPVSKGTFGECEGNYCYSVSLKEVNGVSATLLAMIVDGQDIADLIVDFFGTTRITPFGSLSVNIVHSRSSGFSTWEFVNIDANGNTNSSSGTVQLLQ